MNLHYGSARASKLTQEEIESNPGPRNYAIKKAAQALHHQGNFKFGESAGKQCTSNAYISFILSVIKNINLWKSLYLDDILKQGDRIFKWVGVSQLLVMDELPLEIIIEGHSVSMKMLAHESNLFAEKDNLFENYRSYSDAQKDNGAISMCCEFSIAIICEDQGFLSSILIVTIQQFFMTLMEKQHF